MDLLTANDRQGEYPPSYYAQTAEHLDRFPAAKGALECDVCVVGGGFTGLSTAYHLAQRGYDVIVVEAQRVGFGASGRNGGQVSMGQRRDQEDLEAMVGDTHARQLWDIGAQAVDLVRSLCKTDEVRTTFHDGIVHTVHRKRDHRHNSVYVDHMRSKYGYEKISLLSPDACREIVNSPAYHGGTLDLGAGHVNPLELVLGLARLAAKSGARIFEQSKVIGIDEGEPAYVKTDAAKIKARYLVLGCNGYLGTMHGHVAARVMPINNFIVSTAPMSPDAQEAIIRNNYAVADSKFVVNYFRFSEDHRLLFGGTESYGYRFPKDIAKAVRKPLIEIFPQLKDVTIDHAWGGTLGITMNRMPHYERMGGNILTLSGFSGAGVALATLSGQIAAETIAGQAERFDIMAKVPTLPFPGGPALRSPLLVLAMLWYSLRDKL
ncbi:MAG: FAD-binding oxidoreductase [Yoonia sp.]|uniref:NAD(P)/FAD-dependent oxidoreductase n=1 Tax=Yoonia sp. TaxID=2212373 RepID=UPI00273DC70D|nr:FAD-binding oxidoreductase [Yoonia sp.]MDP5085703.1 FAD-binding oxidoreductase [Yoonia sp.]